MLRQKGHYAVVAPPQDPRRAKSQIPGGTPETGSPVESEGHTIIPAKVRKCRTVKDMKKKW